MFCRRSCPCNYPNNAASNARWCCGDMPHLDLSEWVLEKLVTDTGKGVFGISYRTIDCKAAIANVRTFLSTATMSSAKCIPTIAADLLLLLLTAHPLLLHQPALLSMCTNHHLLWASADCC